MDSRYSLPRVAAALILLLVAAARVDAASITLAWDPVPDPTVTGYLLFYGTTSGVYTSEIDVGNHAQYCILSISPGTYYFVVEAYSATGTSSPSAEVMGVVRERFLPATTASNFSGGTSTDLAVWHPATGGWTWVSSKTGLTTSGASGTVWGSATLGDVPLSGDIDGDGINDLVVWRASTGTWFWLTSSSGYTGGGSQRWGSQALGDVPLLGDIDGDGADDLVVWRASTGMWYWLTSASQYTVAGEKQWGTKAQGDIPMLGDVDGDGRADLIIWRPTNGTWYWLTSTSSYAYTSAGAVQWGNGSLGDKPLIGDMDGDHRSDLVIWRASTGTWYWLLSSTGYSYASVRSVQWGNQSLGDQPYLADMDGDGRADLVVRRTSTNTWYWLYSSTGYSPAYAGSRVFGSAGDIPIMK